MPYISVNVFEGKTLEQKKGFIKDVTKAAVDHFAVDPQVVTIVINEMKKTNHAKGGILRSEMEKQ